MMERNYEFRRRLNVVHRPDRRDYELHAQPDDIVIDGTWSIIVDQKASPLVLNVAKDLQDYLFTSMQISVLLRKVPDVTVAAHSQAKVIVLATRDELRETGAALSVSRSYRVIIADDRVLICGCDAHGAAQGSYYLEDLMNLRESPFLSPQDEIREPIFSPRMVHSGWGLDQYPDSHLNAMAHSGIDAILLFVSGVDRTPTGYMDFNELVDRAETFGLDVYVYSYLESALHPSEPEAEAYYNSTYGEIFRHCPRFKGVILVGESCEFPSKDEHTTKALRKHAPPNSSKPSPGWWPCYDYPEWLEMIQRTVRQHRPDADIVFWTYNWGWAPEKDRLALIRQLPQDITLQVTFEMFEQIKREQITSVCVDYTVSFEGPGQYFSSEAKVAHERGIKLYTMCNTGGLTWDFGVIPYEPVPYQWARRHEALHKAHQDWGLSGLMESHHFGWWPSFLSDFAKQAYWSPRATAEVIDEAIACRDYGIAAAPLVLAAWQDWSEAIRDYIPTNEDQYGPFRIGPSYPLVFKREATPPAAWHAMFGTLILNTNYQPTESPRKSPGVQRIDVEMSSLQRMKERWQKGLLALEQAEAAAVAKKRGAVQELHRLGAFIRCCLQTTLHVKQWWKLKQALPLQTTSEAANGILDEMQEIAELEIANAEAAIPLVEADSRLGWEPSMEYMTDAAHLHWKIEQVRHVIDTEIPAYRQSLQLSDTH
ncbi:hypothetical protein [Paenibacillus eucommiae]|uniref:Uncharacterized protein n=1 Tax=Paenibacillus eucommiae TaxID=1355755 RepID=A0ABS4J018_9BACL|nr:hypothetical protein [Paenibacillus eucommiae]MBP1993184.1 hypothetical protein [Paenibacillus eucommiae]